jgi:hypothetical protein
MGEVIRRNGVSDGIVSLQITRGIAPREPCPPEIGEPWPGRDVVIGREGHSLVERPFTLDEVRTAREAFHTSPTTDLLPIVRIGGDPVGIGAPGPLSRRLRDCYLAHAAAAEGPP